MTNTTSPTRRARWPTPRAPGAPDRRLRETPHHTPDIERIQRHLNFDRVSVDRRLRETPHPERVLHHLDFDLGLVDDNDEAPAPMPTNRLVPPTIHYDDNDDRQQTPRPEFLN